MFRRIGLLLLLTASVAGCSREQPPPPAEPTTAVKLPIEVSGDPEDALPKKKTPR